MNNNGNLYTRVLEISDPSRPLIETAAGLRLTYGDTFARVEKFAAALAICGVKPGDRVAVQAEKSPEALILYLACLAAGAVYLPLNTGHTLAELGFFIADAEPALIVCDPAKRDGVSTIAAGATIATLNASGGGSLAEIAHTMPTGFVGESRASDDLAAILYTSGTTGRSKGAMLTHGNLTSNALALVDAWRFTAADVLIHALPIYHVHGLFVATNTVLFSGASMLFRPKFDAGEVIGLFPRASVLMGVPTFYTRLLAHPALTRAGAGDMRVFISGSAPLLAETHRAFAERTGHAILERYGMTETGMNTSNPYDGERIAGTVGLPLPGVAIRVADPVSGAELPVGEIGVIEVKGPNVFKGYWRMPEKTIQEFRDGWFVTGDLGTINGRGYLTIVGREKDLIISGGLNVYPKEIELAIDGLPGVIESAVVGVPHPDFGEAVVAVVVPANPAPTEAAIIATLRQTLAGFKLPKLVVFVDELPRNAMGKVQKNRLREMLEAKR